MEDIFSIIWMHLPDIRKELVLKESQGTVFYRKLISNISLGFIEAHQE